LRIGADENGKLQISIMGGAGEKKASVTFDNISYDGHGFDGSDNDLSILNGLIDIDDGTP
jgi:hypothetical protein